MYFLYDLIVMSSFLCVLPGLSDFSLDITYPHSLYVFNISFLCNFLVLGIDVSLTITVAPSAPFFSFLCPSYVFLCCLMLSKSFCSMHPLPGTAPFSFLNTLVYLEIHLQCIAQLHLQA